MRLLHTRRKNLYLYLLPNSLWKYAGLCFAHLVSISLPHLMEKIIGFVFQKHQELAGGNPHVTTPGVKIHSTANEVGKGGISGLHHQSHWEMHHLTNHWGLMKLYPWKIPRFRRNGKHPSTSGEAAVTVIFGGVFQAFVVNVKFWYWFALHACIATY